MPKIAPPTVATWLALTLLTGIGCVGPNAPTDPGRPAEPAATPAGGETAGSTVEPPGGGPGAPAAAHSGTVSLASATLAGASLTLNTAGYVMDPNNESITLVLSSSANVCAEVQDNVHEKSESVVTMVLSTFDLGVPRAPTAAGTFAVFNAGMTGTPRGAAALVVADRLGGDCRSLVNGTAALGQMPGGGVTGTITIGTFESGTAGHLTGSFTLTLRAPDSALAGSFDATRCALPAAPSAAPGCR